MKRLKVLLLAGNTLRARAYTQILASLNGENFEIEGVLYGFEERPCSIPAKDEKTTKYLKEQNLFIPDFEETVVDTFRRKKWNFTQVETADANSEELLEVLYGIDSDIIVFAGYGGQLLRGGHFVNGRKYLHMHPGKLPIERGSTTFYYSILNQRNFTVTAFYMTEKIDAGENVLFKEYRIPAKGVNIDRWVDNVIRADCFKNALYEIKEGRSLGISTESSEEYYVIHPVLKHCALLSLK